MQQFFVVGHPVSHSLSPRIHAMFAQQVGIDIAYEAYDMPPGTFIESMAELRRLRKPAGVNVTVPFKADAFAYCESLSERAREARAVNTIAFEGGSPRGYNTDGVGFDRDVTRRFNTPLEGARVLVLGAGGAARGILAPLRKAGCAKLAVANRTPAKAQALGRELGIEALSFFDTAGGGWDIVVNATSASLSGAAPAVPNSAFKDCKLAYDLFYSTSATPFMRLAAESSVKRVVDGLGMLVEQAAESFCIWTGRSPDTDLVYRALR